MWVKYADDDYFVMIWVDGWLDENLQNNVNKNFIVEVV